MHVGSGPAGITVTPGAVWVANSLDLTVSKIDPATGAVTATTGVGDGPSGIVATKDGVWVSDEFDATLDRIDPRTARIVHTVHLGSSPQGLVVGPWPTLGAHGAARGPGEPAPGGGADAAARGGGRGAFDLGVLEDKRNYRR